MRLLYFCAAVCLFNHASAFQSMNGVRLQSATPPYNKPSPTCRTRPGRLGWKMVYTPERQAVKQAKLTKSIKTPDPIPEEGIRLATELMKTGRIYRYNSDSADTCMVSQCEKALAEYTGHKYCVALNSCGSAIFMSLKCVGAQPGDKVLSNAFTFTAVPSAIVHAGCEPVYVECTENYLMDPEHLAKMADETGAKYCMISHMRGKVADMDKIENVCKDRGIVLLEDCAHSLGVYWKGEHTGHKGVMSCFSSQSYKMLNSGEGGFLLTDDDELAAKMILYAGAYEKLYHKHSLRPADEIFERIKHEIPNYSMRMHGVTAAMIYPQISTLDERIEKYNRRYLDIVEPRLNAIRNVKVPKQLKEVSPVFDSVQFNVHGMSEEQLQKFVQAAGANGVPVEVFGAKSNARYFRNWRYTADSLPQFDRLPKTEQVIKWACDIRLPLMFQDEDFHTICDVVEDAMEKAMA